MNSTVIDLRLSRGRFSKSAILLLSSLLALGTVACGSDADEPQPHVEPGPDAGGDVDPSLARIEVTPASASVVERRTVELSAKGFDEEDTELEGIDFTWASSDENLATVDAAGLVTSLRPGTVTITASAGGKSAEATITITESTATSLELQTDTTDIPLDGEVALEAIVKDAEGFELLGRAVTFESDDESIATVSEGGTVLGIDLGETKITAKLEGFEDSVDVRVVHRFTKLFAGAGYTCGLTALGRAWCWGANYDGQLGNGDEDAEDQPLPVRLAVDPAISFETLALGEDFGCGLTQDKGVWCWGTNDDLQLGRPYDEFSWSPTPLPLDDRSYETLGAMSYGVCGLDAGGFAHCWGYSSSDYELGDPDVTDDSALPVAVSAPEGEANPVAFAELLHGRYFSCGLTSAGKLYCWGFNASYQLGDGTGESRAHAVSPLGDTIVKRFALGTRFACALTEDDTTYCWGENSDGQSGSGDEDDDSDIQVPAVRFESSSFVPASFALGLYHGCALDDEGRAFCWGSNGDSQLGRETEDSSFNEHAEVLGDLRFTQLVSGEDHVCGLAKDGKAYCWGDNDYGQLGIGDFEEKAVPTAVVGQ